MRKSALIAGVLASPLMAGMAMACMTSNTACPSPLPAPQNSIPLGALQGYNSVVLAAGVLLMLSAMLIIAFKRYGLVPMSYVICAFALSPAAFLTFVSLETRQMTSCGCYVEQEPYLPLSAIYGNATAHLVSAATILAGAALVRMIVNYRDRARHGQKIS
jgi:hypothetical protein